VQEENANADAASAGLRFWQWVEVNEDENDGRRKPETTKGGKTDE